MKVQTPVGQSCTVGYADTSGNHTVIQFPRPSRALARSSGAYSQVLNPAISYEGLKRDFADDKELLDSLGASNHVEDALICPEAHQAVGVSADQLYLDADSLENLARSYVGLRRRFRVLNRDGSINSIGVGLERETIYTALSFFITNSGQWCLQTDEGRLSLGISMPLHLSSAITSQRLEELRVFGALAALALISGKPPGSLTPALLQYALNGRNLDALMPGFVAAWHPTLDRMVMISVWNGVKLPIAPPACIALMLFPGATE
ncbi:hypothetical protein B0H11DRAFT_2242041 [Mycena galericulata]|nr:hypothetical protein B0H11DRAFT_2242041 [Mycena galericulata]